MEISISERLKVIKNKTWLSFNSIIKNKSIIGLLILFPIMSMVVPVIFIPFWASAGYMMEVNVMMTTGLIYGTIVFGYKKSTLNKNEKLLTKSRSVSYLSALIIIVLFVFLSSAIQLLLLIILNNLSLLMSNWLTFSIGSGGKVFNLSQLRIFAWYWCVFWMMMLEFGIFFLFRNVVRSEKVHYIILLSIIILSFIWGGTLNDYWGGIINVESIDGSEKNMLVHSLFPRSLYWPTLIIFPFYAPGQLATALGDFTRLPGTGVNDSFVGLHAAYNHSVIHLSFAKDYQYRAEWNALILAPIFWTAFLGGFGLILKTKE